VKRRREGKNDLHDEEHGDEALETMIHGVASPVAYSRRVPRMIKLLIVGFLQRLLGEIECSRSNLSESALTQSRRRP
jgi:hypothetical protein